MPTSSTSATSKQTKLRVSVQYAVSRKGLPSAQRFHGWARAALERPAHVTLRVVDEDEGRTLNRNYRGKDYATNVLTFVYSEKDPLAGDIALCAPLVAHEAKAQSIALDAHYAHLTVHGLLHLQGYHHDNDRDAKVMEKRESRIVVALGFADPYAQTHKP